MVKKQDTRFSSVALTVEEIERIVPIELNDSHLGNVVGFNGLAHFLVERSQINDQITLISNQKTTQKNQTYR